MSAMASQITSLTIAYSTGYSGPDQRKHQSSVSLTFVMGIHRWPVNSPHIGPVTRKIFPFNDVIMGLNSGGANVPLAHVSDCWKSPQCRISNTFEYHNITISSLQSRLGISLPLRALYGGVSRKTPLDVCCVLKSRLYITTILLTKFSHVIILMPLYTYTED